MKTEVKNSPDVRRLDMKVLLPFQVSIGVRHGTSSRSSSGSSSSSKRSPIVWHGYTEEEKKKAFQKEMAELQRISENAMKQKPPLEVIDLTLIPEVTPSSSPSKRSSSNRSKKSSKKHKKLSLSLIHI